MTTTWCPLVNTSCRPGHGGMGQKPGAYLVRALHTIRLSSGDFHNGEYWSWYPVGYITQLAKLMRWRTRSLVAPFN
jgi:hypothetical protein